MYSLKTRHNCTIETCYTPALALRALKPHCGIGRDSAQSGGTELPITQQVDHLTPSIAFGNIVAFVCATAEPFSFQ